MHFFSLIVRQFAESRLKKTKRTRNAIRLRLEQLENRALLSASPLQPQQPDPVPHVLWAPETDDSVIQDWLGQFQALGGDVNNVDGSRWTTTATNGGGLTQGHPSTITWSIPPDGTTLGGAVGEPNAPSDLRAKLNSLYGSINTWLPVIQQVFDRWEALCGIDFVYEPNDDGAQYSNANRGILGVRGDMRVSGHPIDGSSGILAYNYFPNLGDMVIDTGDSFYNTLTTNSLRLRNVLAHESGHGIGLAHSLPQNGTKLMEPAANLNFDGPQPDDILRANRGYGDRFEGNDSFATAYGLGSIGSSSLMVSDLSMDDDSDVDFFGITIAANSLLNGTISPTGSVYTVGLEGGTTESFDSRATSDLTLSLLAANGTTVVANANATGLGGSESLVGISVPAGQYFVRVTGAQNAAQMYALTLSATADGPDTTPPTAINRTPAPAATITASATNIDVTFSEIVVGVDASDLVLGGGGAINAVKGTPMDVGGNTWRFPVSSLVNGPVNVSLAPDAGDIEDTAGNDLSPLAWNYSVSISTAQQPPVLAAIGNQTIPSATVNGVVILSATDPNNDPLTFSATAQSIEYHLDQTLNLGFSGGNEFLNWGGLNEKWLTGTGGTWHYILPDGRFYRSLGGSLANDPLVEQLSTADYANTALLYNALANNAPGTVSVNGSTLTINPTDTFVGKFVVTAAVSDGQGGTDSEAFYVTVLAAGTDTTPPTVTNRTPAPGATITTSSTNIDVTFSETVVGIDATDLVLTGVGAASAIKSAPSNIGGNTWRFPVSNLVSGTVGVSLAPDANDIEDSAGNDLAPLTWNYTVSISISQQPPVLAVIGNQTIPSGSVNGIVNLSATDPNNDPLTFSATAQSIEYHLDQTLNLGFAGGNEYLNWGGRNEKWLTGSGGAWFYILPDGRLYRSTGGSLSNDPLVEQVSAANYTTTSLLYNALSNNAPGTVSVTGSTLTINPNDTFAGKFMVTAAVNDGQGGTDSETFMVTVLTAGADTTPPTVTNRSPAPGATVTASSTNIDVTFSESVVGVDATDLVLNGAGAAAANKSAPTSLGGNTWRFPVSNLANGQVTILLAPDANDIEDSAGNDLASLSWTFTVSISVAQQPPVLATIGDQTMPTTQNALTVQLSATDPNNDPLTYTATAQSLAYYLDQSLGLNAVAGEYFNWGGLNEKWMTGANGSWYYITPNGALYRWLGNSKLTGDTLIDTLDASHWSNTALLHNAQANNAPATVSINGSTLTIDPNSGFVGSFYVTVIVSDGQGGTDSEQFRVRVT